MKFSTKSRYAIRLMIDIAQQQPKKVSLKEISERQAISLKYLEQIVNPLVKSGLLRSERGSQGGYTLAKEIKEYSIGEIIRISIWCGFHRVPNPPVVWGIIIRS